MQFYVTVCVLILAGSLEAHNVHLSDSQKEKVHQYSLDCIKETSVKPDLIAEAKKGHFADDEGLKKFTLCFFKKTGIIDHDGKLSVETALAKLPPGVDKAEAGKLLEECKKKSGKDAAETAFEIFKCYFSGTKTHIMF